MTTGLLDNGESATFTVPDDAQPGTTVSFYGSVPGHIEGGQQDAFTVSDLPQVMPGTPVSEIDRLEATISALEWEHADLSATATAIVVQ